MIGFTHTGGRKMKGGRWVEASGLPTTNGIPACRHYARIEPNGIGSFDGPERDYKVIESSHTGRCWGKKIARNLSINCEGGI